MTGNDCLFWWTLSTASLSYHHIIFSNLFSVSNTSPFHSCLKIYFKYGANNVLEILCTPYSRVIRTFYLFKECSDCIGALSAFVKSFLFFYDMFSRYLPIRNASSQNVSSKQWILYYVSPGSTMADSMKGVLPSVRIFELRFEYHFHIRNTFLLLSSIPVQSVPSHLSCLFETYPVCFLFI